MILMLVFFKNKKFLQTRFKGILKINLKQLLCRGSEQIRTAVGAFAELCLASRPRNLCVLDCKGRQIF